jgi:hypothetical protein
MKWVLIGAGGLLIALAGGVAFLPMSVAAGLVADRYEGLHYSGASGSVWNGKLSQVQLGDNVIGDVLLKTNPMGLLSGKISGTLGLARADLAGQGDIFWGLAGQGPRLSDLKLEGRTSAVPGLPREIRDADGAFTITIDDIDLANGGCVITSGEVWTDALAKVDFQGDWVGPELRGPVSCKDGGLKLEASGEAATGEVVRASITVADDLRMGLDASVDGAAGAAASRLAELGFRPEGAAMVLRGPLAD